MSNEKKVKVIERKPRIEETSVLPDLQAYRVREEAAAKKTANKIERKPRIEEISILPDLQAYHAREEAAAKKANEAEKNSYTNVLHISPPAPIAKEPPPIPSFTKAEESAVNSPPVVSPEKPKVPENFAASEGLNRDSEESSPNSKEYKHSPRPTEEEPSETTNTPNNGASNQRSTVCRPPRLPEPTIGYIKCHFKRFPSREYREFLRLRDIYFFEKSKLDAMKKQQLEGKRNVSDGELLLANNSVEDKDNILGFFKSREDDNEDKGQNYFDEKGSPFCRKVRDMIMEFEQDRMEMEEPAVRASLWKQRREELFCLKYLCKKSVELKNDVYLIDFIKEIKDLSDNGWIWSRYNALTDNLREVISEYRADKADYRANQWMNDVEKDEMRKEIERLKKANEEERKKDEKRWREEAKTELRAELRAEIKAEFAERRRKKKEGNTVPPSTYDEANETPSQALGVNSKPMR